MLTTTGAVSGEPRTTPLLFARDGDDIVVAGSNFGQEHHPAWSKNLIVHPDAIATVGGKEVRVTAELLIGDEALPGFEKMTEVVPVYAEYKNPPERSACSVYALGRRPETLRKSIRCVPRSPGRGPYMNPAATRYPDSKTL